MVHLWRQLVYRSTPACRQQWRSATRWHYLAGRHCRPAVLLSASSRALSTMSKLPADWPAPAALMAAGRQFIQQHVGHQPKSETDSAQTVPHIVLACDSDADGLSGAVVMHTALQRLAAKQTQPQHKLNVTILPVTRGQHAHRDEYRQRILACHPTAIIIIDQGSRAEAYEYVDSISGSSVPVMLLDHHSPPLPNDFDKHYGLPSDCTVPLNVAAAPPVCTSSYLCYVLAAELVDLTDVAWVACIGTIGDLGLKGAYELPGVEALMDDVVLKQSSKKNMTDTVSLVNAPRRCATQCTEVALRVLQTAKSAKEVIEADNPKAATSKQLADDVIALRDARQKISDATAQLARTAPRVVGDLAILTIHTPYQVHPLISQRWTSRLKGKMVLTSNDEYVAGQVNFSMRCSDKSINMITFLKSVKQRLADERNVHLTSREYANGHSSATGGALPREQWNEWLDILGFTAEGLPKEPRVSGGKSLTPNKRREEQEALNDKKKGIKQTKLSFGPKSAG